MFKFIIHCWLILLLPTPLFAASVAGVLPAPPVSRSQPPTRPSPAQLNEYENLIRVSSLLLSNPVVVADWLDYLNKLSGCVPGIYALSQINPILIKQYGEIVRYEILGYENNQRNICNVTIMYYAENDPRLLLPTPDSTPKKIIKYPTGQECLYRPSTIEAIVAFTKNLLSGDEVKVLSNDALSLAIMRDCKFFVMINGVRSEAQ